jgi:DNA-binding LacI/PurR family transcriptional regulator
MANIKEVAKLSNSSITTVSRVINNSGYVKQETRDKILEAIKELGYMPLERSEGTKDTKTIGFVVPNIENPFFGKMARHLSRVANGFNYNILLFDLGGLKSDADDYLFDLINNRVDGLIYASSHRSIEVINTAKNRNMPIVVLDREIKNECINSVTVNNNYGAYMAIEHLIKLGHKHIAFIGGAADMEISTKRKEGYIRALEENQIPIVNEYIGYGDYSMQSGYECMETLYKANPKITAVLAANDNMAIGAINYLSKVNVKIGKEISVIGFDNIELAACISPSLTTVEYPMERMSEVVVELILRQIKSGEDNIESVTLFPKLVVRQSCGVAPLNKEEEAE